MPKNYGFARCSLGEEKGQDLNRQVRELKTAGAEEIITERVHGDAKVKPQLDFLLEHIEPNSSLYVTEVSRLSRSTQQLCEILNMIKEKHLRLVILNSVTIDCRNGDIDPMSMAFLQMAGIFSELELWKISSQRQTNEQKMMHSAQILQGAFFCFAFKQLTLQNPVRLFVRFFG